MNTKLLKVLLAGAVVALGCSSTALATKISGTIAFDGTVFLDASIPSATAITGFLNAKVSNGTQTGDYVGTDGTAVTMAPFTFLPSLSPDPVDPLWNFTLGNTYKFKLDGPIAVVKGANPLTHIPNLTLDGMGWASITGFEDTLGAWELTTQGSNLRLSFSSVVVVPDGGTTALLLGFGLLGIGLAARRSKKA